MRSNEDATAEQTRTPGDVKNCCAQQLELRKYSGSEFRTVGSAEAKHENQMCGDQHVIQSVDGQQHIADDGHWQRRGPGDNN